MGLRLIKPPMSRGFYTSEGKDRRFHCLLGFNVTYSLSKSRVTGDTSVYIEGMSNVRINNVKDWFEAVAVNMFKFAT